MPKVVILDDRADKAERIQSILKRGLSDVPELEVTTVSNVTEAEQLLNSASLWVIDVFLLGDYGHEVSNGFIRNFLVGREVPYCRCSSGSGLRNTENLNGFGVYDDGQLRRIAKWPQTAAFVAEVRAALSSPS